ncbi:DctP family TRAP transporter solute-binding subunit [Pradoshia sp. D12]|uniref:DctP family TRAP transporter solute-binding subunit n=1 Tax=Bacillaceae TaxID=186817 RepID=UPI00111F8F98|nr:MULTISPECIES: DctP family TRAP transporter solute-binding subunit [Bacillaceae]QFK71264.1 DctP family TRAP transporter solute-binding subunit [Pradoshia sp. D12]TPF73057.1 DctP family TRAP transporter solute-binding subunit [Bacillus sp. D12]
MKSFLITAVSIIAVLVIYMGVQHDFGQKASLPPDFEQEGLNEQIVINFSHVVAENTPKGLTADKFATLVEKKTNGAIQVEVYPNSTLYSDGEELQALQNGDIEMIAPSFSKVTDWIPEWQVLDLPYLLKNYKDIEEIFTGPIKGELLGMLDEYGVKGLAFWNNGFKQITTAHSPVKLPDNLEGLTLRTMPSNMLKRQLNLVGAENRSASFDQVYSLLEREKLDGQENTISNIDSKGFYQVQDHMILSNHGILGYAVMINNEFWNSLPKNLQQAVIEAMDEATAWNLTQSEQMNRESLAKLEASAELEIYHLSDEELRQWQQTFLPLYDYYKTQFDEKLLKKIQESID